ncbi:MAG: carbohydrate kinase family protein [Anaerolineales bacterium]|nr:carbohydrate kinase family protein [Anaerolineales bacterium]
MLDLYSIGEMMWLTTLNLTTFPKPGSTTELINVYNMIGNDATITALMASRMGLKVKLCSNSVFDHDGNRLIEILRRNKVGLDLSISKEKHTPINFCLSEQSGRRTWLPPLGDFFPTLPHKRIDANCFYLDFYEESLEARLNVLSRLISQNQKIYLNLSDSSVDRKVRFLQKNNKEKLHIIQTSSQADLTQAKKIAKNIMKLLSPKGVIVTIGEKGSVLCTKKGISIIEINIGRHKKNRRNMGAGASFSAGFISGIASGASLEDSHAIASEHSVDFCLRKDDPLQ